MAPRTIYANLADGLQPFNLWDQSLADMGNLGVIPCMAAGTNAIILTPIATVFPPNITIPQALQAFSFVAAASSSGAVTIQVGTTAALKLYRMDGVTQASTGDIVNTVTYLINYNAALNSAAGGFQILAPIANEINPIISGATITGSTITTSTYNGNIWTAGTGTLTIAAGKTETFNNTLTFAGTDGTTQTFQASDTIVGRATTDTLTNKTLTAPVIATISNSGTLTLPSGPDTIVARGSTDTLVNKAFTGPVGINNGVTTPTQPLHVGDVAAASAGVNILSARASTGATAVHGFAENSTINLSAPGQGMDSFDARMVISGTQNYDHSVSYQGRTVYGSSGTITFMYGGFDGPTINSGTATNQYGWYAANPLGAGAITNSYGFYCENFTRGGTLNYAFFAAGTTPSKFGGNVTAASLTAIGAAGGVGYGTGAGGTVTQITSKATGVTLNTACGQITMNGAALAAGTIVSFVLTNTSIAATDVLILNQLASGSTPGAYTLNARAGAGSASIDVRNNTAGSLSEAIVLQFALIKAVNS